MTRKLSLVILLLVSVAGLSACSRQLEVVKTTLQLQQDHPRLPDPIGSPNGDITITIVTPKNAASLAKSVKPGESHVAMPAQQWLSLEEVREDTLRYLRELLRVACYYRKELNEPQCRQFTQESKP